MEHLYAAVACAVIGGLGGLLVPRLIAWCPEPEHNPAENPEEYPDHVPFAELAARAGLAPRAAIAGAMSGALMGGCLGWTWALPWLLYLVPVCTALTVIDYVTWYLPSRLIRPSWLVVLGLVGVAAVAVQDWRVLLLGAAGWLVMGAFYGLMWFINPRGLAQGDVRLGALLGAALLPLGLPALLAGMFLPSVIALVALVPMKVRGNAIAQSDTTSLLKHRVPYGPAMIVGALLSVALVPLLSNF